MAEQPVQRHLLSADDVFHHAGAALFAAKRHFGVEVPVFAGAYLSLTGVFEHFNCTSGLVWPDYIMDEQLGTQFGRSRGPFMESVAMGRVLTMALGHF